MVPAGNKAKHLSSVNIPQKQFIIIIIIIIIIIRLIVKVFNVKLSIGVFLKYYYMGKAVFKFQALNSPLTGLASDLKWFGVTASP